jgi:hypothetical protein
MLPKANVMWTKTKDTDSALARPSAHLGLRWRVKESFVRYVARQVDGRCSITDGAEMLDGQVFLFEPSEECRAQVESPVAVLPFVGDVRFSAHAGMLFVRLGDPCIRVENGRGVMSVLAEPADDSTRFDLAEADINIELPAGREFALVHGTNVRLTETGAEIFGSVYPPGSDLEDFSARVAISR